MKKILVVGGDAGYIHALWPDNGWGVEIVPCPRVEDVKRMVDQFKPQVVVVQIGLNQFIHRSAFGFGDGIKVVAILPSILCGRKQEVDGFVFAPVDVGELFKEVMKILF